MQNFYNWQRKLDTERKLHLWGCAAGLSHPLIILVVQTSLTFELY